MDVLRSGVGVKRLRAGGARRQARTGGGLVKRLGRAVLWLLVVVLLLRGLASVLGPRDPVAAVAVPRVTPVVWPDDGARSFAADFARAYLSYSPKAPDASAQALQRFVAPELAGSVAPQFAQDAPGQAVGSVSVAGTVALDSTHALITVAAAMTGGQAATRYLTVPVAHDDRGGLVVSDLPSFSAGPARASIAPAPLEPLASGEQPAIEDVVSRFLRSYLAGDAQGLEYLVPAGVRVGALGQPEALVGVDSVSLAAPARGRVRDVLADVRARDGGSGAVYALRYRLRLVRSDRWYVAAVNQATRKGG